MQDLNEEKHDGGHRRELSPIPVETMSQDERTSTVDQGKAGWGGGGSGVFSWERPGGRPTPTRCGGGTGPPIS